MAFKMNVIQNKLESYRPFGIIGVPKVGKMQPLYSKIQTPNGEIELKNLKEGDLVLTPNGTTTRVIAIHPQGKKAVYEVEFTDGSKTRCGLEHLWQVRTQKEKANKRDFRRTVTLKEIIEDKNWRKRNPVTGHTSYKYEIPVSKPVQFEEKELTLDPYLLGILIGDGYICGRTVTFSTSEPDIVEKVERIVGKYEYTVYKNKGNNYSYNIVKCKGEYKNAIRQEIIKLGLDKCHSGDKFIPDIYKYNSIENRVRLLQGLFDTDGYISTAGGSLKFYTTSKQLKNDVVWLIQSLGGLARVSEDNRPDKTLTYCVCASIKDFTLVTSDKHLKKIKSNHPIISRSFKDYKYIGEEECVCIELASEDGLYLTDNFIVTHNTTFVRDLIIKYAGSPEHGLLISCGNENGYKHLDNLQYEVAQVWDKPYGRFEEDLPEELKTRGLVQIIDELVETKQTNGIKIVALDTIDELYAIAYGQVKEEHRKLKGEYPKSLNDALGGFGNARKRIIELVNQQLDRLSNAGYAVFWIGHTKNKTKEDAISGVNYEVITNNLEDNFFSAIEARSQMVMNFVSEREFENVHSETSKGFDGKTTTKEVGTNTGMTRYIYFRDNGLVHASCNFPNVPTKIELSVDNFLKVFNEGVEGSRAVKLTDEQRKAEDKKEDELNALKVKAVQKKEEEDYSESKEELIKKIKEVVKSKATVEGFKESILEKITALKINPKQYEDSNLSTLKEFLEFVSNY